MRELAIIAMFIIGVAAYILMGRPASQEDSTKKAAISCYRKVCVDGYLFLAATCSGGLTQMLHIDERGNTLPGRCQ